MQPMQSELSDTHERRASYQPTLEEALMMKEHVSKTIAYNTETHFSELERMEDLEHRFHLLEKALKEETKGCFELLLKACSECVRSIPLPSILATITTLLGTMLLFNDSEKPDGGISVYFPEDPLWNPNEKLGAYSLACISSVASGPALLVAFAATGVYRDFLFGHAVKNECMWCLHRVASPVLFYGVGAAFMLIFLLMFVMLAERMLPMLAVAWIMEGSCKATEPNVKRDVAETLAYLWNEQDMTDTENRVDSFCQKLAKGPVHGESVLASNVRSLNERMIIYIFGVTLVILGVVWQLAMHAANHVKVRMEDDLDEAAERDEIKAYYAHHGQHYGAA